MNLRQTLQAQTYRHLWAITQARSLNPGRSPTKSDLIALVETGLTDPHALQRDLDALSPAERLFCLDRTRGQCTRSKRRGRGDGGAPRFDRLPWAAYNMIMGG